ncbi:hypothetical protein MTP99_019741 [Tenebrio molitor]|nr:hypothetical protein MTP99_019741 [Tenebrio molitor]
MIIQHKVCNPRNVTFEPSRRKPVMSSCREECEKGQHSYPPDDVTGTDFLSQFVHPDGSSSPNLVVRFATVRWRRPSNKRQINENDPDKRKEGKRCWTKTFRGGLLE